MTQKLPASWEFSPAAVPRNLIENKHESDGEARQEINIRASNEGYTKVREDFTITEKVPTRAFSEITNLHVDLCFKLYHVELSMKVSESCAIFGEIILRGL